MNYRLIKERNQVSKSVDIPPAKDTIPAQMIHNYQARVTNFIKSVSSNLTAFKTHSSNFKNFNRCPSCLRLILTFALKYCVSSSCFETSVLGLVLLCTSIRLSQIVNVCSSQYRRPSIWIVVPRSQSTWTGECVRGTKPKKLARMSGLGHDSRLRELRMHCLQIDWSNKKYPSWNSSSRQDQLRIF